MQRRTFTKSTLVGAFSISISPTIAFGNAPPINKKSLKFGMIKEDLSLLEKFQLVKDLGFHGIELNSPHDLNESEILEAKDKTGLEIPGLVNSLHWKKPLSDPDPLVRETCTESMITALHQCKKYGGTTVLLVPAVVNEEVAYDQAWERCTAEIKRMLPTAKETGVKIAIENSDAVIKGSEELNDKITSIIDNLEIPVLDYQPIESFTEAYSDFYLNKVL